MREKKKVYSDFIGGILIIFISTFLYILASGIQKKSEYCGACGPDLWPKIILGGFIIIGSLLAILSFKKLYFQSTVKHALEQSRGFEEGINKEYAETKIPINIMLYCLIYSFIIMIVGYVLGTLIFLISLMSLLLGIKKGKFIVPISLIWMIFIIFLFARIFFVPFPKGIGIFYDVNIFLIRLGRGSL